MSLHHELVELRLQKDELERTLGVVREKVTALEQAMVVAAGEGATERPPASPPPADFTPEEPTTFQGKLAAFVISNGGPVDLATIRRQRWAKGKSAQGLANALWTLGKQRVLKRVGTGSWAAA